MCDAERPARDAICGTRKDGKILVMARSLPAKVENTPQAFSEVEDILLWALAEGTTPARISKRLAHGDHKKATALRRRIYRLMERTDFEQEFARRTMLIARMGLGAAVKAHMRKAAAGRVDAIKLLYEATGFYNPRTEVNHSGEVQITIKGLPRPEPVVDEVVDATVVDD